MLFGSASNPVCYNIAKDAPAGHAFVTFLQAPGGIATLDACRELRKPFLLVFQGIIRPSQAPDSSTLALSRASSSGVERDAQLATPWMTLLPGSVGWGVFAGGRNTGPWLLRGCS
jgi:hypothetical protein